MKTMTRAMATFASVGALAVAMPVAANASDDAVSDGKLTCYVQARKPAIIGGVGNTARGVGAVRCSGGGTNVRLVVSLQKNVNGYWRQQGAATACRGYVAGTIKTCTDTNRASVGLWRTKVVATIIGGPTRTFYSGTIRFVPARTGGFTM